MEKTENLYDELRERVKNLVDFMKENNIDSTSINLETVSDFTFCSVKHNKGDDILKEFTYIFRENEVAQEVDNEDIEVNIEEEENEAAQEVNNENIEVNIEEEDNSDNKLDNKENEHVQNNESKLLNEDTKGSEIIEESVDNHEETLRNDSLEEADIEDEKPGSNTNDENKNKRLMDFKEEYIYQKEVIGNILREYSII